MAALASMDSMDGILLAKTESGEAGLMTSNVANVLVDDVCHSTRDGSCRSEETDSLAAIIAVAVDEKPRVKGTIRLDSIHSLGVIQFPSALPLKSSVPLTVPPK